MRLETQRSTPSLSVVGSRHLNLKAADKFQPDPIREYRPLSRSRQECCSQPCGASRGVRPELAWGHQQVNAIAFQMAGIVLGLEVVLSQAEHAGVS